ncbi:MAG: hypothetical protein M1817_001627 [Caeruleum heppii]|nr:MAG: hypothetical protein M1817_001627 [Caeruleum heppii]
MPQPLSSKEASLFRQLIRNYEDKQYKKGNNLARVANEDKRLTRELGLKAADHILRKNPNHGDTLAMKALIINSQGKTEEAFALAKIALRNDMKSHVCWHVYGLLYRAEKNFEEAIKAYKFALKLEPDSPQIQRDLANLQVQMRDYQGYIASRKTMLQARSGLRQNWTALAIANHLAGNLSAAESVLTTYEETLKSPPPKTDLEHSEAVLYKNSIIAEMGDFQKALDHLDAVSKHSLDRTAAMEMKAGYLLRLDKKSEAEQVYRALVDRNPENRTYFEGLERSIGAGQDRKSFKQLYDEIAEKNPRGDAARRIPLDFLEGDDFREAADRYLRRMLVKGVPSTFANIKALYRDNSKQQAIQALAEGYTSEKPCEDINGDGEKQVNGSTSKFEESTLYFLAQHYNYHRSRDLSKAMAAIDKAIELYPKSVDFHLTKARIWKHHGNLMKASETMERARTLDERDRYINTKAAKYQLRNDESDVALRTMSKFTRNETVGGPLGDLHEMQCMWYISEDGHSYARQGKLGLALKRYTAIYDIFDVWQEDQFDFHSFSLRKGQIRAYVDMVRWEDRLRSHPYFSQSAVAAIDVYLRLHDDPRIAKAGAKAARKAARAPNGTMADGQPKRTAKDSLSKPAEDSLMIKKDDKDPLGHELLQTKEPLKEAMKFLTPLLEFRPTDAVAQSAGFEVYVRRRKYLLALKCLLAASAIDSQNPTIHEQSIRFRHFVDTQSTSLPAKVSSVISSQITSLTPTSSPSHSTKSLSEENAAYLSTHKSSPAHVIAAIRVDHLLHPSEQKQHEERLLKTLDLGDCTIEQAKTAEKVVGEWGAAEDVVEAFAKKARGRWMEATCFWTAKGDVEVDGLVDGDAER